MPLLKTKIDYSFLAKEVNKKLKKKVTKGHVYNTLIGDKKTPRIKEAIINVFREHGATEHLSREFFIK